jgi:hypothetical protein
MARLQRVILWPASPIRIRPADFSEFYFSTFWASIEDECRRQTTVATYEFCLVSALVFMQSHAQICRVADSLRPFGS